MEETKTTEELKDTNEQTTDNKLTMTQEELNILLQKEGDKRVSSAQSKWERQTERRVSEADKLAKMDEESRREYEFEQREKALAAREQELILESNKAQCSTILASKGLPGELVDFVVDEDADKMNDNIKLIDRLIKDTVSKQVLDKIGGETPKAGSSGGPVNKESFSKMSLREQMDIYQRDPELYKKLTQ